MQILQTYLKELFGVERSYEKYAGIFPLVIIFMLICVTFCFNIMYLYR